MEGDAGDLVDWARAFWGGELFSADSVAAITDSPLDIGGGLGFGLSTIISGDGDATVLWHNGALNGYASWLGYRIADGVGVSVLANFWKEDPIDPSFPAEIAASLFAEYDDSQ